MLSAGDGGRSLTGRAAGGVAGGSCARPSPAADRLRQLIVDVAEVGDHASPDVGALDLAQLEHEGVDDVLLLDRLLAAEELAGLAVVIGEALRADPTLVTRLRARRRS